MLGCAWRSPCKARAESSRSPVMPAAAVSTPPAQVVAERAPALAEANGSPAESSLGSSDDVPRGSKDRLDLPALARAAAQRAERKAIDETLARFHWNRRKAATYLGVSYKTLLNKMKECGISESRSQT